MIYTTIEKYRLREKAELKAAKKIRELLGDQEKGFSYLINLLVNHYLHRSKYSKQEVQEAEELGYSWSQERDVPRVYGHFFKFVSSLRLLLSLLIKRNEQTLRSFVSNCEFIVMDMDSSSSINLRML